MNTPVDKGIEISMDKSRLDLDMIVKYLQEESYWAGNRDRQVIQRSIDHSICFGVYKNGEQIGFARAVTDQSTVFYLADFFILPKYQQSGTGQQLMHYILDCDDLKEMRGILTTQTAHSFYEKFGFSRNNDIVQRRIMVRP